MTALMALAVLFFWPVRTKVRQFYSGPW
jgi:hypothetical protein